MLSLFTQQRLLLCLHSGTKGLHTTKLSKYIRSPSLSLSRAAFLVQKLLIDTCANNHAPGAPKLILGHNSEVLAPASQERGPPL